VTLSTCEPIISDEDQKSSSHNYDPNSSVIEPVEMETRSFIRSYRDRFPNGISWSTTIWFAAMHVGAVVALFYFSWAGLVTFLALHFVTACLGVTLGYHRLLTHGSFVCPRIVKYFFSFCGMLSTEGSPLYWVSTHRKHHAFSDQPEDPHSPLHGFWWSHIFWLHPKITTAELKANFTRWAPDLFKDPVQRFFHQWFFMVPIGTGVVLFLVGHYLLGGIGISMVLWGLCARIVAVYHGTWFVNSATHVWGYRNYTTKDESRNLWWVAIVAYGEGWHNNHHAYQRLARHGHRWWEFDVTYAVIWTMKKLGIAWKVQDQLPETTQH
jgi:stearoyl-CoA desaturase (delta-9 desaturase)